MGDTLIDLTGQKFERLTVLHRAPNRKNSTSARWVCQCICGTISLVDAGDLRRPEGGVKSCGCLQREIAKETRAAASTKHGMAFSPEYRIWAGIKRRCLDPNMANYAYYGGRGITICDEWKDSFEQFYEDMGPRPSPKHSIEREKNELGYFKENCFWATLTEQARNRRNNHMITINEETRCLAEWLEIYHLCASTFHRRRKQGMSEEHAITTPSRLVTFRLRQAKMTSEHGQGTLF